MFDEMRQLLRATPFEPFRIHLNDGRFFDVRHPEFIAMSRTAVHVGVPAGGDAPERIAMLQMRNITSHEKLAEPHEQS